MHVLRHVLVAVLAHARSRRRPGARAQARSRRHLGARAQARSRRPLGARAQARLRTRKGACWVVEHACVHYIPPKSFQSGYVCFSLPRDGFCFDPKVSPKPGLFLFSHSA